MNPRPISIEDHCWQHHALKAAIFAVNIAAGRRPEEVGADILGRTLASLRSKAQPEGTLPR